MHPHYVFRKKIAQLHVLLCAKYVSACDKRLGMSLYCAGEHAHTRATSESFVKNLDVSRVTALPTICIVYTRV